VEGLLFVVKDRDPQITPIPQIFDFSRRNRRALLRAGSARLSMTFVSKQHKAIKAETRGCATLRVIGTGSRAAPWKVRTLFEDAHQIRRVRILEKPEDSFEGAQLFPRCAPKTAHLRVENGCGMEHEPRTVRIPSSALGRSRIESRRRRTESVSLQLQASAIRADFSTSENRLI
jgi:hypothetical protein